MELIQACIENIHKYVQSLTEETVQYFTYRYEKLSPEIRFNYVQLKIIEYNEHNKRGDHKFEIK